eukprot:Rmarinus@m.27574
MSLDVKFSQVFGERSPHDKVDDADIISAIEFDQTGDYLATGDRGGRLVLFVRDRGNAKEGSSVRFMRGSAHKSVKYEFYTEFQSHEPEFDCLKSLEIEERINKVRWCKRMGTANMLISTNDKTVKLWKINEKKVKQYTCGNASRLSGTPTSAISAPMLKLPSVSASGRVFVETTPRRVYSNAHAYHVNSICPSSDGEHFLSADDLRVNLWNYNLHHTTFTIVDMKPPSMDDLKEVITSAEMHPSHCANFVFASSRGIVRLCDLRANSLCDTPAKVFKVDEPRQVFTDIVASMSDVKYSRCGRYILARDYMSLKVWDINMERAPLKVIPIQEYMRPQLAELYQNESIFDKFECAFSGDGNHMLTGFYNNTFHIFDRHAGTPVTVMECAKTQPVPRTKSRKLSLARKLHSPRKLSQGADAGASESLDVSRKLLHVAWHPQENILAFGASCSLYLFAAGNKS